MASSTPPPVNKIDDGVGSERHDSCIFFTLKYRHVAFPHAGVAVYYTSEHERVTTDYAVVRDDEPAEHVRDLVEHVLEARNVVEGCKLEAPNH